MRVSTVTLATFALLTPSAAIAQSSMKYSVTLAPADAARGVNAIVHVSMTLPDDVSLSRASLIMPRAIPMGYGRQMYDEFVTVTLARTRSNASATIRREDGPRWSIRSPGAEDPLASIQYDVDLVAMENTVLAGGDSSRARRDFIGLLGYSIFGYVEGLEERSIALTVAPPPGRGDWPVFSTLAPKSPPVPGTLSARAVNFYGLADSQILMGPGFQVKKLKATSDLFMAIHAEDAFDDAVMTPLAEQAFDALVRYYGTTPFSHFTLMFDYLKPLSPRHTYGFSMEHMESATFGALTSAALTANSSERERASWRYNVAHHISHAWVPKRSAGEGYFPFRWELAPLIDTIWLSEGFGQYAAADALSDVLPASGDGKSYRENLVEIRFRAALREMPDFLKQMSLIDLSRTASTVYSEDFRTGRSVFARGGMMAYEMDEKIRATTGGAKRLRDGLRGLVAWSAREKRPFRIDELPIILKDATGVDTRDVMERWLAPMNDRSLRD